MRIGIRREDKNEWERRAPLTPADVSWLHREQGLRFRVQPAAGRIFPDADYAAAGAEIAEDLAPCDLVLAVKEIPARLLRPGGHYLFFSHTMKCQPYNMPMLAHLLELGATLFDYELIADERGRRLVFFGNFAGLAGMIDTLHGLGCRLSEEGIPNPFTAIRMAHAYPSLAAAKEEIAVIGARIARDGLDPRLQPLVIGFAGYGNVSRGAQEILDLLPVTALAPEELPALRGRDDLSPHTLYKVVFKEEHLVEPRAAGAAFDLQDYYDHPEHYAATFDRYLPHLNVLVNCIYWTEQYPRLITHEQAAALFAGGKQPHLRIIGDISCDIDGSIQMTRKVTAPDNPCYVYEPATGDVRDGYAGYGPVVMAVDNLPCELAAESSTFFSRALRDFVAEFAHVDLTAPDGLAALSAPLRGAIIAQRGELTPRFAYIKECLAADGAPGT